MTATSTSTQESAIRLYMGVLFCISIQGVAESAPQAIHPATRQSAWPSDGVTVAVNPPSLLWPAVRGRDVRYRVRLSQDRRFPADKTMESEDLLWAIFNPHKRLRQGIWYWQYEVLRGEKLQKKSDIHNFAVTGAAREYVTPSSEKMLSACPSSHPRILITADELAPFRRRVKNSPQARAIVREADGYVDRRPPSEQSGRPDEKGKDAFEQRNFAKWASKALGNRLSNSTSALAKAYIITGDKRYGRQAILYAVHVAGFDPDGVTSRKVSDFADGTCLRAMALAYDSCFDLFTAQEKSSLQEAIAVRAGRMFASWRNNLETRIFSAHIWQHILHEFAEAAFATLGEVDEAELWAAYVYELWLARVPLLGGEDGGWANGNNYFGTNFVTLVSIPTFFEQLTDADFFAHPWYRNSIYYMIYTWPPGSGPDGFGDGCERRELAPLSRLAFADILGRRFRDPYAGWYVRESLKPLGASLRDDGSQRWHRLRTGLDSELPRSPSFDLPQARLFGDIGVVVMHTDLADTPKNLMLAFRSSPFGSFNHAHADQNSFNILYGGKRVFSNSGYYIGYGDAHFRDWYVHSRGHNTVLIDNEGQLTGSPDGYGQVIRYAHDDQITYCLGDAPNAYGDAGLTVFRRHVAFIRPSIVVIYDELQADHPAQWSWLLHSPNKISLDAKYNRLGVTTSTARSRVDFFAATELNFDVHNRFDPPALNWRNRTSGGKLVEYPDQWHAIVSPAKKVDKMRYLAVIQVLDRNDMKPFLSADLSAENIVRIGLWSIAAGLNPTEPATLEIKSSDGQAILTADHDSVNQ
jgi:hypothetical protein